MAVRQVYVGERVSIYFRERSQRRDRRRMEDVQHLGTVTAFDERGIHISLDVPANGVATCYASYAEVNHTRKASA